MLLLVLAGISILLIDQLTKLLTEHRANEEQPKPAARRVRIRHVANRRPLPLAHAPTGLLVWAVIFSIVSLVVSERHFFHHAAARLGLGMALGGALSNVWDQFWDGAVVDFLDLGLWPVFNVADLGICIGVTAAMWFLY